MSSASSSTTKRPLRACNGNTRIVTLLLQANARSTVFNYVRARSTPLLAACINGHVEVLRVLLQFDTELEAYNDDGWSALMYASAMGHYECVKLLLGKALA
uniref:Uncharacterized protein n=1 Tax=Hucho hucho TaxID=62062 RepID=A0A4W5MDZ1_9TELE